MVGNDEIAELLLPETKLTPEELEARYPERNLPEGAYVTRFAPSPTGFLHTGSLFTAFLANRLAKQSGGVFFLRIEDTDTKRTIAGSAEELVSDADAIHRMLEEFLSSVYSVAMAIIPLTLFFALFQKVFLKFTWNAVREMLIGILMASIGVIVFLTAIYTGFIPVATAVGTAMSDHGAVLILLGALLGFLVAYAEPAVAILCARVENASGGMVSKKTVKLVISSGVALFVAIGMAIWSAVWAEYAASSPSIASCSVAKAGWVRKV